MNLRSRANVFGFLAAAIAITAAPSFAQIPEGVSPGAVDRIDAVESRCPSFYWVGVSGAQAYELVVYRLPDESQITDAKETGLSPSDEVLYSRVPGGATAWQPRLADGLDPGGSYVWFVRSVFREEADEVIEAGDWSAARFFSVPAMPSSMEVEAALDVLRRWHAATGNGSLTLSAAADPVAASVAVPAAATDSESGVIDLKSVPTATAAIKGSTPDATGETYGVVGISNSLDGAGVAAANTAGGPDLVLDGSEDLLVDAELSQSGIDRSWGTPQTFDISNSGGGGMMLRVDGIDVTTTESELDADKLASGTVPDDRLAGTYSQPLTLSNATNQFTGGGSGLTGVDADTLDGTNGADFATDAEAAGLVAAHAASADHDGRYYTETELNTSGTADAVHWDNLGGVPPGFADGVDDDTQNSPGPGLILDGGQIRIDWSLFHTQASTLDSGGNVGQYTSIAIGADGLGLISYHDYPNGDLKVAHCDDIACSSAATTTLDSAGTVGRYTAIAIGADGLGLISYYDYSNADLKVAHCIDTACSSATIATLDSTGDTGYYTSITIGTDELGLISYFDNTDNDLKVAHCDDTACSSATIATLDSVADVLWGGMSSIAVGVDGLGIISYFDSADFDLKVAHCVDTACSSATTTILDSVGLVGYFTSIAIGTDGLVIISYFDSTDDDLKVAHCDDTACSSATLTTLDIAGDVGYSTSIAIGTDGLGIISYRDLDNGDLKVARCADTACSSATTTILDSVGDVGQDTSIAIGADGLGLISYHDITNDDLKAAHLGIGVP